jgi:tetratricopeptide (TPR) repeat protein
MATKKAGAAKAKKRPQARASAPKAKPPRGEAPGVLPFEVDPRRIEASLDRLREQLVAWAKKGRYTKVRFKFRGKQLLPDMPLAAVLAVEGATFYWTGLLRALVFNLAGRTLIDVELVNDSEKQLARGKEALLSGDLDEALAAFEAALDMDHDNPAVHLNLGVAWKLTGDRGKARRALERAKALDPDGPIGAEAERLLATLKVAPATEAAP